MSVYVRLIERNDHEGERWSWWLEEEGNKDALKRLRACLEEADPFGEEFELTEERATRESVDMLVRYSDDEGQYYPDHNRVDGVLTLPENLEDDVLDILYKGGINNLFE